MIICIVLNNIFMKSMLVLVVTLKEIFLETRSVHLIPLVPFQRIVVLSIIKHILAYTHLGNPSEITLQ